MAPVRKTIYYATQREAVITNATETELPAMTVFIPESSPTFISCYVDVQFHDQITATGGTINEHRVALKLGTGTYSSIVDTGSITHQSRPMGLCIGPYDFTAKFTSDWTGTSMSVTPRLYFNQSTGTGAGMVNCSVILHITYEHEETAPTQVKSVQIPLDGNTAGLATTQTLYGSDGVLPQLTSGGLLPENNVVIRDWFLVFEGNEGLGNVNYVLNMRVDSDTTWTSQTMVKTFNSPERFCRFLYKPATPPDPTTTHLFYAWSNQASKFFTSAVTLYVTYEFTLSGTTRVLNSLLMPIVIDSPAGRTTAALHARYERDFVISDPGTITPRHSAHRLYTNIAGALTHFARVGSQAYVSHTISNNDLCGCVVTQQRFDSGSGRGLGHTLVRGYNKLSLDIYTTNAGTFFSNTSGLFILNYESDISPQGLSRNTQTRQYLVRPFSATSGNMIQDTHAFFPTLTGNHLRMATCVHMYQQCGTNGAGIVFSVQKNAGEEPGVGFETLYADVIRADGRLGTTRMYFEGRPVFKRFPQDADVTRMDPFAARVWRSFIHPNAITFGLTSLETSHSHTWVVAGNITGNDPSKTTTLKLFRDRTGEAVQTQTLSAGTTAFSFTVYDDTEDYYVEAFQDATKLGRSALGKAA